MPGDLKITQLTADLTPAGPDLLVTAKSPFGSGSNRKVTITDLFAQNSVTGPTGPAGATGPTGYTGPGNFTGYTGPAGAAGATGYTGYTGPSAAGGLTGSGTAGQSVFYTAATTVAGNSLNTWNDTPTLVGTSAAGYTQNRWTKIGNMMFTAISAGRVKFVDVTNPAAPTLTYAPGIFTIGNDEAYEMPTDGRYLYFPSQNNHLYVLDSKNPVASSVVADLDLGGGGAIIHAALVGEYLYIVDNATNKLKIVNISSPTNPVLISTTSMSTSHNRIAVQGGYAYCTKQNGTGQLQVFDVTNPYAPSSVFTGNIFIDGAQSTRIQGRYLYGASYDGGGVTRFNVVDVVNPASPSLVANVSIGVFQARDIFVAGRYAYISNGDTNSNVYVFDIKDPTSPTLISTINTGANVAKGIYVSGKYLYVGENNGDLRVFELPSKEIDSATIHSLEVGDLDVLADGTFGKNVRVGGGLNVGQLGINSDGPLGAGGVNSSGRILGTGAAVASANDLTLTTGNMFGITGTTTINAITTSGWNAGGLPITLIFLGALTVKHNTAGGAGTAPIFLAGSVDLTTAANTVLGLVYDGTEWQECFRKVA